MLETQFRYGPVPRWFKGNTHLHTTRSDGGKSPEELRALYAGAGYDFICLTDHWVASRDHGADDQGLQVIDGVELDGNDESGRFYHVVCLGTFEGIHREMGLERGMAAAREQGGFLVLAHPYWCGNSAEDALAHPFHAVEVYNHVCSWLNGKGSGLYHWDAMLERGPEVLGLAVDDAHISTEDPGWNGGWIMVGAADRSPPSILRALRAGHYYSTCGPEIRGLQLRGRTLVCQTTPVRFARVVGPRYNGTQVGSFDGRLMTEFEIPVPDGLGYARLEIEDAAGARAWTNTLFVAKPAS